MTIFIVGSHSGVQVTPASNTISNKGSNADSKTIQSSLATSSNCSVTKLSTSLDKHSAVNHSQLSGTELVKCLSEHNFDI